MSVEDDRANGYEEHADAFITGRDARIGVTPVREWAATLPRAATVLDLGCGSGDPISRALLEAGCLVHAIDASPRLVAAFRARFPGVPVACEPIESSTFFNRTFDAAVAIGVMFLLPLETQAQVIQRISLALNAGGSFLFTSPAPAATWKDALTDRLSISAGADAYRRMLAVEGLTIVRELEDEASNHYYISIKR